MALVEHGKYLRADAAVQCKALLEAARRELTIQQMGPPIDSEAMEHQRGARTVQSIEIASAYRASSVEWQIWNMDCFPKNYDRTGHARAKAAGGPPGDTAVAILVQYFSSRKAAPGFSNHSDGRAVDFKTRQGGTTYRRMALGLSLNRSGRHKFALAFSVGCLASACHSRKPEVSVAPALREPASMPDTTDFLVYVEGQGVVLRTKDGPGHVIAGDVSVWLYDAGHILLWSLGAQDRLFVTDLRAGTAPVELARQIPDVGSIWVEWPSKQEPRFARPETGCDESVDAVEIKVGRSPSLRVVDGNQRLSLSPSGRRWLAAQAGRKSAPHFAVRELDGGEQLTLPKSWEGCERERCGLSVPFGSGSWRLVLAKESMGADCVHRSCLLFNPDTAQFASPPVLADAQGTLSSAESPPKWTAAERAQPGVCGPYLFDAAGSTFLVRNYLCSLAGSCHVLGGEAIGWVDAGAVVGNPG